MTKTDRRPAFAAVDWGTSSFRLWLLTEAGAVLDERRSNEGMAMASAACGFPKILKSHLSALGAADDLPVVICGMAGARQGWVEAGYVTVPALLDAVLEGAVRVPGEARDIRILPGLANRDPAHPDVMRGEETQLLGATADLGSGEHLACMPGTHSKWVRLEGSTVTRFSTYMTGELFDVIARHSLLAHSLAGSDGMDMAAFRAAVQMAVAEPARATNLLFAIRAGQLLQGAPADVSRARLSGTLIGLEIAGASGAAGEAWNGTISLFVSGKLGELYATALETLNRPFRVTDADHAVRDGLIRAARALWPA
ncbi:2-dehydro-3-deoxygalactonokinase [Gellertiella hungarica]|uniref:2-dehydro-3-deoxygalactonokinase n=1 Tax=Gellertiella hungarica TaxID=1572859 RepID=A0A7W6J5K7_9HYPH|nr:2-dehydro-3-deoxygalactonokinase [Gellertiella hungarica]MBB4064338.1 2-dehydro-3-deoxygalactonokinase [Gellertiella hungarica]